MPCAEENTFTGHRPLSEQPPFLFCIAVQPTSDTSSFQTTPKNLWSLLILYFFSFVELEAKAQTPLKNGGQTLGDQDYQGQPLWPSQSTDKAVGHPAMSLNLGSAEPQPSMSRNYFPHDYPLDTLSSWSSDSSNDPANLPHP